MKSHEDDTVANETVAVEEQFPRMLSGKEKISYAMGDVGNAILFDVGQLYLLKYLTDALQLPALMAGSVFLVAKIWDAFADVAVGTWIDNQKKISKKGKFRPFILYAALPLALLSIANFSVPNFSVTVQEIWAYVFYMIFGTVYSISNIAYGSMQPTMTKNSVERAELASYRNIGANVGGLFANVLFIPLVLLFPTQRIGYAMVVIMFAIFGCCCQLICYKNIKENYTEPIINLDYS